MAGSSWTLSPQPHALFWLGLLNTNWLADGSLVFSVPVPVYDANQSAFNCGTNVVDAPGGSTVAPNPWAALNPAGCA